MKKKYGENHLRKEEKESSKKGMNKKNRILFIKISIDKEQNEILTKYKISNNWIKKRMQAAFNSYVDWVEDTYSPIITREDIMKFKQKKYEK